MPSRANSSTWAVRPDRGLPWRSARRLVVAVALGLLVARTAAAQCTPPQFRIGRDLINYESESGAVHISLRPTDFTLGKLVCLARSLRRQHPTWKNVSVLMFSSEDAAVRFVGGKMGVPDDLWRFDKEMRAFYSLDALRQEEYLAITPAGFGGTEFYDTRIDLRVTATPHCRFELNARCLLALDEIAYPDEALRRKVSGKVTVTGAVTREGKLTNLTISDGGGRLVQADDSLGRAAIDNLKTWWLEPAQRTDGLRITFSYEIDASLPRRGQVDVQLALPGQITINTAYRLPGSRASNT